MNNLHSVLLIAVVAAVTFLTRFLPFGVFSGSRKTPKFIEYSGKALPFAAIGMLVVYCLRNVSFSAPSNWIPSLISSSVVVVLYLLKRNSLLSIIGGTACYMLLVQLVF